MANCAETRQGWQGGKWITKERRLAIYIRDNFQCVYCGKLLKNAKPCDVTLDHIIPRSQTEKNDNTNGNLITACKSCNSARQDKSVEEYAPGGALERIKEQILLPVNIKLAKSIILGKANDAVENMR